MKKLFSLFLFVFCFLLASPAQAVFFSSGENLSFPKTQKFNESVFLAGKSLTIDSDIVGDLICAGQDITINSKVTGDVICAGQNIEINGPVEGNVRLASQNIDLNGSVARNITVASQNLLISKTSNIRGDVFYGVQNVDINGIMGRDLAGGSESITITGSLLRNAKIATQKITIADSAKLGGDLEYYIEKTGASSINEKSIKGKVTRHEVVMQQKEQFKKDLQKITPIALLFKILFSIASSYLLVLVLLYFTPNRTNLIVKNIKNHPLKSALVGFAVLVTGPIAVVLSFLTVIGAAVGVVVSLFYILSLILAFNYVALRLGQFLSTKYSSLSSSVYLSALAGCSLLVLIVHLPFIGMVLGFIIFLIGLGASLSSYLPEK